MIKPKKKQPADTNQLAHSFVMDAKVAISGRKKERGPATLFARKARAIF